MDKDNKELGAEEAKAEPSELEKFRLVAEEAGIDADKLIGEIGAKVENALVPKLVTVMGNTVGEMEKRLGATVSGMIGSAVTENLPGIVQKVASELEEKFKAAFAGGGGRADGKLDIGNLLRDPEARKGILEIIQIFRPSTGPEQLAQQFNLLFQGMKMGLNLKTTPEMIDQMTHQFDLLRKSETPK